MTSILPRINGKTAKERSNIKAFEISNAVQAGKFDSSSFGVSLDIQQINYIDGCVELFAKAYKNDRPLGFGKDGSVEIERFRFFNPPLLVADPNGSVMEEFIDPVTKSVGQRVFSEDPVRALREALAHSVSVSGIERAAIKKGKIGNTTTTVYADAGGDGHLEGNNATYLTAHNLATATTADSSGASFQFGQQKHSSAGYFIWRAFFPFNISGIGAGQTISSLTLSLFGNNKLDSGGSAPVATVVSNNQASNTALAAADFDQTGTTSFATITYASWSTSAYNDFSLNASGIAQADVTGWAKYALVTDKDIASTAPPSNHTSQLYGYSSNQAGTTNDPKLVAVHAGAATSNFLNIPILGCG